MRQLLRRRSWKIVCLLCVGMLLLWQAVGLCDGPKQAGADYSVLLEQLKGGDTAIDYAALRSAYTRSAGYDPYARHDEDRTAMNKAMNERDYETAVRHAQAVLEKNYLDMEAHFFCNIAYRVLKNDDRQRFHAAVLKGLIGSLYASGSGQSRETAYTVISTDEEYFLLRINGYKVIRQKLLQKDGIHYDAMEVEALKSGERNTVYFNVELPFAWLNQQLRKNKAAPEQ